MIRVLDFLYGYVRGAVGFSLLMAGASFLAMPRQGRMHKAFGTLFVSVGALFTLSALDPVLRIPDDPSNLIVIALIYALSQSLFEIGLYLFGDEAHEGTRRRTYVAGAAWSLGLWLLSFLDYPLGLEPLRRGPEDQGLMGPFHTFASFAIYAWPLALSVVVTRLAQWKFRDLPRRSKEAVPIIGGLLSLAAILALILVASLFDWAGAYKAGHTLLELWMLAWYFFIVRKPDAFVRFREEIGKGHERNLSLSEGEASIIRERLQRIIEDESLIFEPSLSVGGMAAEIKVPSYRLSHYFNTRLGTTFSAWLNTLRVEYVCARMAERPDLTILEISVEAGYGSKAVFNAQFRKLKGVSPNEYRRGEAIAR